MSSEYNEYDIFRMYLNGRCTGCNSPQLWVTGRCVTCGSGDIIYQHRHVAADIYHCWQINFRREWKWNDAHRRGVDVNKFRDVPIHHRSIYDKVGIRLFCCMMTDRQRRLANVLKTVLSRRRKEEMHRLQIVRRWKARWTYRKEIGSYTYEKWISDIPRTRWMTYAIEEGLTYRHLRTYGYIPYVDLAEDLQDEHEAICNRATIRFRRWRSREIN